ncbi:hypothetical protein ILUMI_00582 [Ignelater luminosus]|uniref:THAP-type domain-containing protein n=1 Tax=Ignelater luminosus TaxID=2038154 RepID=A0A8K0DSD7_IGNLU|nr:hypothetical protein ILUMI_00582 [Ignelater luminosus]
MNKETGRKVCNNTNCCVVGCHSRASRNMYVSFHSFPKEGERRMPSIHKDGTTELIDKKKAWVKLIRTGKEVTKTMGICSLHFKREDYILPEKTEEKRSAFAKSSYGKPTLRSFIPKMRTKQSILQKCRILIDKGFAETALALGPANIPTPA